MRVPFLALAILLATHYSEALPFLGADSLVNAQAQIGDKSSNDLLHASAEVKLASLPNVDAKANVDLSKIAQADAKVNVNAANLAKVDGDVGLGTKHLADVNAKANIKLGNIPNVDAKANLAVPKHANVDGRVNAGGKANDNRQGQFQSNVKLANNGNPKRPNAQANLLDAHVGAKVPGLLDADIDANVASGNGRKGNQESTGSLLDLDAGLDLQNLIGADVHAKVGEEKANNNRQQSNNQRPTIAFNPNGFKAKLANPPSRPNAKGNVRQAGTPSSNLIDVNLGRSDSNSGIDIPGLLHVGLGGDSDDQSRKASGGHGRILDVDASPLAHVAIGGGSTSRNLNTGNKQGDGFHPPNIKLAPDHRKGQNYREGGSSEHGAKNDRYPTLFDDEHDNRDQRNRKPNHQGGQGDRRGDRHNEKPNSHKLDQDKHLANEGSRAKSHASRPKDHQNDDQKCARGFFYDHFTGSCEKGIGHSGHEIYYPVHPNHEGRCPVDYKKHPFLPLCYPQHFDMEHEVRVSGPHRYHPDSRTCQGGWTQHPYLYDICIDSRVNFDLDLGKHGAARPDVHGNCPSGWRHHSTILNLCLDSSLDIDLGNNRKGRKYGSDDRCISGFRPHPHIPRLCVDSATDINLFKSEIVALEKKNCVKGYLPHPKYVDLCVTQEIYASIQHDEPRKDKKPQQKQRPQTHAQSEKHAQPQAVDIDANILGIGAKIGLL